MLCPSTIVHLIFAVLFYVITFAYYDTIMTKVLTMPYGLTFWWVMYTEKWIRYSFQCI